MPAPIDEERYREPIDGKVYLGYADVAEAVSSMALAVAFFEPDLMLAIGYPGLFIARALEHEVKRSLRVSQVPIIFAQLEIHDGGSPVRWSSHKSWGDRTKVRFPQWFDESPESLGAQVRGQRVLIVDAIDDTRATLQAAVERLRVSHAPSAVGVFVLHDKLKPKVGSLPEDVQYIVAEEMKNAWVCYPWDVDGTELAAHEALARRCAGEVVDAPTTSGFMSAQTAVLCAGTALAGALIGVCLARR